MGRSSENKSGPVLFVCSHFVHLFLCSPLEAPNFSHFYSCYTEARKGNLFPVFSFSGLSQVGRNPGCHCSFTVTGCGWGGQYLFSIKLLPISIYDLTQRRTSFKPEKPETLVLWRIKSHFWYLVNGYHNQIFCSMSWMRPLSSPDSVMLSMPDNFKCFTCLKSTAGMGKMRKEQAMRGFQTLWWNSYAISWLLYALVPVVTWCGGICRVFRKAEKEAASNRMLVGSCAQLTTGCVCVCVHPDLPTLLGKACGCPSAKASWFHQLNWPSIHQRSVRPTWLWWKMLWRSGESHFRVA